ncbi:hypothetical protein EUX98_g6610 [Antrodiella citrinella]|uniref:DUF6535 domain-containing protein n=1 Tax=Antrodiella citrinella TaxID=2447956 RepID=A0A4S4MR51_9APHY|nr:hypothetical protein EUX98_g6610 [Antrodiella citrinella]
MSESASNAESGPDSSSASKVDLEIGEKLSARPSKPDASRGGRTYGASKIWTMYNEKANTHDTALVERIKGSMDSILVFAGLFSAVVTAFLLESYQMLNPSSGDVTVYYLEQISQEIAKLANSTTVIIPPVPPSFTVSPQTIAVNILWILSLIASLACALGATLIQSWTGRYLRVTSRDPDEVTRARSRAWYFDGLRKSQMEAFAGGVPAVLHVSLFLFLAGLVVFMFPVNHDVAHAAMGAAIACAVLYLTFAFLDVFVSNSPYKTPFSMVLSFVLLGGLFLIGLGLLLGAVALVLALPLAIAVIGLPLVPFTILVIGPMTIWKGITEKETPKLSLPESGKWSKYRKHARVDYVSNRVMGVPPEGKPKQDVKALKWLLAQTSTPSELEAFVDGIEVFIERSPDKKKYAKIVLELGGTNVGTFSAGLGVCVGHLLESCTHAGSEALPLEHRRARAVSAVRAMATVFAHTESQERITPISVAEGAPLFIRQILEEGELPSLRWIEWVDIDLWEIIVNLRKDDDQVIALHASYLFSLLLHRALIDVAARLDSKEVQICAPPGWNLRTLLSALQHAGDERLELYELAIAVLLIPHLDKRATGITVNYSLPEGAQNFVKKGKKKGRPILVTLELETEESSDSEVVAGTNVSPSTFHNEATLLALSNLLNQIPTHTSLSHPEILSKIIHVIAKDGTAAGTSGQLQSDFISALEKHHVASTLDLDTASQINPAHITARSVFHFKDALDDLIPLIESVDDPACVPVAQAILTDIRSRPEPVKPKFHNQRARQAELKRLSALPKLEKEATPQPEVEKEKETGESAQEPEEKEKETKFRLTVPAVLQSSKSKRK